MTSTVSLERLIRIMRHLRDPQLGCVWDQAQTFATIAPYTIEEAYEVADAIDRQDPVALCEELGDLLLQVVFHSQIADELGIFDFATVANGIADKMEARHPHIFGDAAGTMDTARWEDLKAAERDTKGQSSAMDGVANALPALVRAQKLQARAARDGFDWPDKQRPLDKLMEEVEEFTAASDDEAKLEEAGDLLFAAVNVIRAHDIEPEAALRAANKKFERRYRTMERLAANRFSKLTPEQQEALWQQVKNEE